MDQHREDTRAALLGGSAVEDQSPAQSRALAVHQRTPQLMALDHLALDLRAACPSGTALSWAQITQCTLSAVQHGSPSTPTTGTSLKRRMALNHDLYRAFMARKRGRPWAMFDGPTLFIAVDDLIAAAAAAGGTAP